MSHNTEKHVFIIGGGIIGCSAAHQLSKLASQSEVPLKISIIDSRPWGSFTSSASTECYRNWWTEPTMLKFVGKSIDLYEELDKESKGAFGMNRPGYVFFSANPESLERYKTEAQLCESYGAGSARFHHTESLESYNSIASTTPISQVQADSVDQNGIDVISASSAHPLGRDIWPKLAPQLNIAKHVRNCGWIYVDRYIGWINEEAKKNGVSFLQGKVSSVHLSDNHHDLVRVVLGDGSELSIDSVVLAAGPSFKTFISRSLPSTGPDGSVVDNVSLFGRPMPSFKLILEVHAKVIIRDELGVIPRGAPLMLFDDPAEMEWTAEQHKFISEREELSFLLKPFRGGVHFRPLGGQDSKQIVVIWTYNTDIDTSEPHQHAPLLKRHGAAIERLNKAAESAAPASLPEELNAHEFDQYYGEICLRGLANFVPGLKAYFSTAANPTSASNPYIEEVAAGYYVKTPENRPFIGPAWSDEKRVFLASCFSGFGIMTAPAAGHLLASHVLNSIDNNHNHTLDDYHTEFLPSRYLDDEYLEKVAKLAGNNGQL